MTARRVVRLLLLALLAAGVVGMHTTGHPEHNRHASATPVHIDMHPPNRAATVAVVLPELPTGMDMEPAEVCRAFLTSAGLLVILVALGFVAWRVTGTVSAPVRLVSSQGRGPPWGPLGLRLAHLSVLRT